MNSAKEIISKYKSTIKTIEDVKSFFSDLNKFSIKDNFHPDNDFADYLNLDGNDLFTDAESKTLNTILHNCYGVCKKAKKDIYKLALDLFQSKRSREIKMAFEKDIKKCYALSESLEELIDMKLKYQSQDYLNWKHVEDGG